MSLIVHKLLIRHVSLLILGLTVPVAASNAGFHGLLWRPIARNCPRRIVVRSELSIEVIQVLIVAAYAQGFLSWPYF